ncbi:hypothetical protein [uncultured Corynebacterium sp.]|uniref:hypothetical protein n=1 Tax=uncultured Corynebacterium sp. TaxID=159447 RepID=UPI0025D1C20A|nr:hypothetical protein [uncultured Corynebacterium sp.]
MPEVGLDFVNLLWDKALAQDLGLVLIDALLRIVQFGLAILLVEPVPRKPTNPD